MAAQRLVFRALRGGHVFRAVGGHGLEGCLRQLFTDGDGHRYFLIMSMEAGAVSDYRANGNVPAIT